MANTVCNFPGIPTGLTATFRLLDPDTLALQETVTLTESGGIYGGPVVGAFAGQFMFELLISGTVIEQRLRTIADDVGPYTIDSALEIADRFASASSGPWVKTVTIEESVGSTPLENATIRLTEGADLFVLTTDSAGEADFGLRSATYVVAVTKAGYGSYTGTMVVTDATGVTIQLTLTGAVPVPSDPLLSTGVMVCYDELGAVEQDVTITVTMTAGPGTAGYALDTAERTETSTVAGLVTFAGLIRGATYSIRRGPSPAAAASFGARSNSSAGSFVVPAAASFDMTEVIGTDA